MKHRNAVAGTSGGLGGLLVCFVAEKAGLQLDPVLAAGIATAGASLVLFVGRNGIRGLVRVIWKGQS